MSYLIDGRRIEASPVFDTFWRFASARQSIYESRLSGSVGPWSDDPVLSEFRFTNVYRAADRVSQFLISEVIYDGVEHQPEDYVFRTLLFKFFNKSDTWRGLEEAVGPISWSRFDLDLYAKALGTLSSKGPIYSPAYVIPPPQLGASRKHENHLALLAQMMEDDLTTRVVRANDLGELYEVLYAYPSIGRFLAYQFAVDLNYTPLTELGENDFVMAGPGAVDGVRKCFGPEMAGREEDAIRFVVETQEDHFERLGLSFNGLFGRRLHLIDAQNLFCEVDKYSRVVHPEARGLSGRTRIKQRFKPVDQAMTTVFPPKWGLNVEVQGL